MVVSMKRLLESGVHFGHQTKRWDPKMKPYIFGAKNGIHIIDLQKTTGLIDEAYNEIKRVVENGGKVLFVGTKKQAQDAIAGEADRCGMPYVNYRWLGGMMTNIRTIRQRVDHFKKIDEIEKTGKFDKISKKEIIELRKQREKMEKIFTGIKEMTEAPALIFVVDTKKEHNAILEAKKLGITIVGLVDTNCNPDEVDYVIPGNDDAIRSIKLISEVVANAVMEGLQRNLEGREINEHIPAQVTAEVTADEAESKDA